MKEKKPKNYGQRDEEYNVKKGKRKKKRSTNKEFVRVTYAFVGLFLLMMGYLVYFNLFRSQEMISSPYNYKRQDIYASRVVRGKILDAGGNVLAETQT
ncbi:MAG: penicillin-binding protein 2, partial [Lachnospiraceae bacterium]